MIDYATLCRAIDDWKAGHQPSGVIPAAPTRVPTRPAEDEEGVVEYSAAYDIGEARPEAAAVPDSTVIYQLPEDYEEGEVAEGDVETDADADVETDADADADADAEADVDIADDEQR